MDDVSHFSLPPQHDNADWKKLRVDIQEIATGREVSFEETGIFDPNEHAVVYLWEEGNYSCDCNRRLFFYRAIGDAEKERDAWDKPCSQDQYRARVCSAKTGRVIYEEEGWGLQEPGDDASHQ